MKQKTTKLVFKRETLRILTDSKLTQVVGGGESVLDDGCITVVTTRIARQSAEK